MKRNIPPVDICYSDCANCKLNEYGCPMNLQENETVKKCPHRIKKNIWN